MYKRIKITIAAMVHGEKYNIMLTTLDVIAGPDIF